MMGDGWQTDGAEKGLRTRMAMIAVLPASRSLRVWFVAPLEGRSRNAFLKSVRGPEINRRRPAQGEHKFLPSPPPPSPLAHSHASFHPGENFSPFDRNGRSLCTKKFCDSFDKQRVGVYYCWFLPANLRCTALPYDANASEKSLTLFLSIISYSCQ